MRSFIRSHVGDSDGGLYCIIIDGFDSFFASVLSALFSTANGSTPFRRLKRVRFPVLGPPRTKPSIRLMGLACGGGRRRGICCCSCCNRCCCVVLSLASPVLVGRWGIALFGDDTDDGSTIIARGGMEGVDVGSMGASSYNSDSVVPIFWYVVFCDALESCISSRDQHTNSGLYNPFDVILCVCYNKTRE